MQRNWEVWQVKSVMEIGSLADLCNIGLNTIGLSDASKSKESREPELLAFAVGDCKNLE